MTLIPHAEPPHYFTFPGLAALGLPHATTTRLCPGIGEWSEPAAPFPQAAVAALRPAGLDLTRAAWARQVHGTDVAHAPDGGGFAGRADILTTTAPGVPLAIFTADCLALILYDPDARVLGAAHVGWRGAARGATPAAVDALGRAGARAERLHVAISPSIGPCCYEVDEPVVAAFAGAYRSAWERWVQPARTGHWMLDLWRANEELLGEAGVGLERIENPRLCTACNSDRLYSYRRGNRGRLVTVAALP